MVTWALLKWFGSWFCLDSVKPSSGSGGILGLFTTEKVHSDFRHNLFISVQPKCTSFPKLNQSVLKHRQDCGWALPSLLWHLCTFTTAIHLNHLLMTLLLWINAALQYIILRRQGCLYKTLSKHLHHRNQHIDILLSVECEWGLRLRLMNQWAANEIYRKHWSDLSILS